MLNKVFNITVWIVHLKSVTLARQTCHLNLTNVVYHLMILLLYILEKPETKASVKSDAVDI